MGNAARVSLIVGFSLDNKHTVLNFRGCCCITTAGWWCTATPLCVKSLTGVSVWLEVSWHSYLLTTTRRRDTHHIKWRWYCLFFSLPRGQRLTQWPLAAAGYLMGCCCVCFREGHIKHRGCLWFLPGRMTPFVPKTAGGEWTFRRKFRSQSGFGCCC